MALAAHLRQSSRHLKSAAVGFAVLLFLLVTLSAVSQPPADVDAWRGRNDPKLSDSCEDDQRWCHARLPSWYFGKKGRTEGRVGGPDNLPAISSPDAAYLPANLLFPELQPPRKLHSYLFGNQDSDDDAPPAKACPTQYAIINPFTFGRNNNNIMSLQRALILAIYLNRTLVIDDGWRFLVKDWDLMRLKWCIWTMAEWAGVLQGQLVMPGGPDYTTANGTNSTAPPGLPTKMMCFIWTYGSAVPKCDGDLQSWPQGQPRPEILPTRISQIMTKQPYRNIARAILYSIKAIENNPEEANTVQTVNLHFTFSLGLSKHTARELWSYLPVSPAYQNVLVDVLDCFFGGKKRKGRRRERNETSEENQDRAEFPGYKFVGIHHRGLEGGCSKFGGSTDAAQKLCALDMAYISTLVNEADPSIDLRKTPTFIASDDQNKGREDALRAEYTNIVQWRGSTCNAVLEQSRKKNFNSTATVDRVWLDMLIVAASTVFVGQAGSTFSGNVAMMREADGREEKTNVLAGYKESSYGLLPGLVLNDG